MCVCMCVCVLKIDAGKLESGGNEKGEHSMGVRAKASHVHFAPHSASPRDCGAESVQRQEIGLGQRRSQRERAASRQQGEQDEISDHPSLVCRWTGNEVEVRVLLGSSSDGRVN